MSRQMNNKLGGLHATLYPAGQLIIKGTDYVIQNNSPVPIRIQIFNKSKLTEKLQEAVENATKTKSVNN